MKVVISQPMKGLTEDQIRENRSQIVKALEAEGYTILETIFNFNLPNSITHQPVYYLGESLKKLAEADVVYFMKGWENARGCVIEHETCIRYGIPTIEEQ